ncbi:hypothetical protein QBC39DRAFT_36759 [Podospora conica]|nr:hypothetical protein QBC39DRAFT_36759 [Schizothecium conicum]
MTESVVRLWCQALPGRGGDCKTFSTLMTARERRERREVREDPCWECNAARILGRRNGSESQEVRRAESVGNCGGCRLGRGGKNEPLTLHHLLASDKRDGHHLTIRGRSPLPADAQDAATAGAHEPTTRDEICPLRTFVVAWRSCDTSDDTTAPSRGSQRQTATNAPPRLSPRDPTSLLFSHQASDAMPGGSVRRTRQWEKSV